MKASAVGRFEQSFMFHMIRDFFLLLVAVTVIELTIRYARCCMNFARTSRRGWTARPRNWPTA